MSTGRMQTMMRYLRHSLASRDSAGISDAELLDRFVSQQDEAAFELLVWRYGSMVLSVCRRLLRDGNEVEDVFQATFVVLLQRANSIRKKQSIGSWLYKVTYRIALFARRQRGRQEPNRPSLDDSNATPPDSAIHSETHQILQEELSRMPEKYQQALVLYHLEERNTNDAARLLGCPKGTLLARLKRGRDMLRARMKQRGIVLSAACLSSILSVESSAAGVSRGLVRCTVALSIVAKQQAPQISRPVLSLVRGFTMSTLPSRITTSLAVILLGAAATVILFSQAFAVDRGRPEFGQIAIPPLQPKEDKVDRRPKTITVGKETGKVVWSPDGNWMASYTYTRGKEKGKFVSTSLFKIWNVKTGKLHSVLGGFKNMGINAYAFSPDSKTFAISRRVSIEKGDHIDLWDVQKGAPIQTIDFDYGRSGLRFVFSPDGKDVAVAYGGPPNKFGGGARIFDLHTGKVKQVFLPHDNTGVAVAYSPDGKLLATGSYTGEIVVWDVKRKKRLQTINELTNTCVSIAFTPDGKHLATCSADGLFVWNIATGKGRGFQKAGFTPRQVRINSKGTLLAVSGVVEKGGKQIGEVSLWDLKTGNLLKTWENTGSRSIAFDAKGETLAVFHSEGVVRYWETRKYEMK